MFEASLVKAGKAFFTLSDILLERKNKVSAATFFAKKALGKAQSTLGVNNVLNGQIHLVLQFLPIDTKPDGAQLVEGEYKSILQGEELFQLALQVLSKSAGFDVRCGQDCLLPEINRLLQPGDFLD